MNPSNKHREQAREIVRAWLLTSNPHHLIGHKESLINRIASALSSRDTEVREVLEGLSLGTDCWCPVGQILDHTPACLVARALYAKLQPTEGTKQFETARHSRVE